MGAAKNPRLMRCLLCGRELVPWGRKGHMNCDDEHRAWLADHADTDIADWPYRFVDEIPEGSEAGGGDGEEERGLEPPPQDPRTPSVPRVPAAARTQQPYRAPSPSQASVVRIRPAVFETSSQLLWQAYEFCVRVWGWEEMDIGDFLDTYLVESFKRFGVRLLAWDVDPSALPPAPDETETGVDELALTGAR